MAKTYILVNGQVRTVKDGVDPKQAIASLQAKGYEVQKCSKPPSISTMERWMADGIAKATDGCSVEPDGTCPHGCKSWMLHIGVI